MINKGATLVVTTINNGDFLQSFTDKINEENAENIDIIVIPDLKTPPELFKKVNELKKKGYDIKCPTVEEQEKYLKKLGSIAQIIPYNSDNRRNIGYLMAYQGKKDVLISVDDDNFPIRSIPFYKGHIKAIQEQTKTTRVESSNGWFNECELLTTNNNSKIFARGFPYYARTKAKIRHSIPSRYRVAINAGLWKKSPDVDAITHLVNPTLITGFSNKSILLGKKTWSPVNTQNTSLRMEAVPSYYFVKMGYPLMGLSIDRYGDIFSGYFAVACAKHMGDDVRIGNPIVNHLRNSHNYMKDSMQEMMCIQVLEGFLPELENMKLSGNTYSEAYLSLAENIDHVAEKIQGPVWNDATRGYFHYLAYCMRSWIEAIGRFK